MPQKKIQVYFWIKIIFLILFFSVYLRMFNLGYLLCICLFVYLFIYCLSQEK